MLDIYRDWPSLSLASYYSADFKFASLSGLAFFRVSSSSLSSSPIYFSSSPIWVRYDSFSLSFAYSTFCSNSLLASASLLSQWLYASPTSFRSRSFSFFRPSNLSFKTSESLSSISLWRRTDFSSNSVFLIERVLFSFFKVSIVVVS